MDIEDWRKKIDEVDRKLVALLSERAKAAIAIGKLKRETSLPIYEPDRERVVFENVQDANRGPLPGRDLVRIYERIIDVMRALQRNELASERNAQAASSEAGALGRAADAPQPQRLRPVAGDPGPASETGKKS